jgi:fructose-1,6-bisphosphatase I
MPVSKFQTVQQHILEDQRRFHPQATGEFSWLLSGLTLASKMVESRVRRAGLADVLGVAGHANVHGETVQKLDVFANQALLDILGLRGNVGVMASEENDSPILVERDRAHGRYVVVFDPLDGSSNIDVNVSVGTIFSILRRDPDPACSRDPLEDLLQPGVQQIASGYIVYGPSTMMVYTAGHGVHGFTLDPNSCNEANSDSFPDPYRRLLAVLRSGETGRTYSSRYVGSLVADFHRTLLKGGIFLYPPTRSHPGGKLRLLYEANPIAFLAEQAGGKAIDGTRRILEIRPTSLHQRTPLAVGSNEEIDLLASLF